MFTNDGQISSGMSRVSEISQKFDEEKWKLRKVNYNSLEEIFFCKNNQIRKYVCYFRYKLKMN